MAINNSLLLTVDSEAITNVWYKYDSKKLVIDFKSGASYEYNGVAIHTMLGLIEAESKGAFIAKYIKPYYEAIKW